MVAPRPEVTAYEILGVHPSAPAELIGACYWTLTKELQAKRAADPGADTLLHRLTRAYESVSDPVRRAGYNLSIGYTEEPLTTRQLPGRRPFLWRLFRRRPSLDRSIDPHEVLGLDPGAPQSCIEEAYRTMRDVYLRLPRGSRRRGVLLNLLEESYAILRDPEARAGLNGGFTQQETVPEMRRKPKQEKKPPPAPESRTERTRPRAVPRRASGDAGAFVAGVRWVAAQAARLYAAAAPVVWTGLRWIAANVVRLSAAAGRLAARGARAVWTAVGNRLGQSRAPRGGAQEKRSRQATGSAGSTDDVFLDRLASSVKKTRTEARPEGDGKASR